MSRRRKRFTCDTDQGLRVVLAYSPADARSYFESRGLVVTSVAAGDYRQRTPRPTGARPILSAVKEAAAELGLKHPVKVRVSNRRGGNYGSHMAIPVGGGAIRRRSGSILFADSALGWCHEIMVKGYLDADQMGRTLWHELAHALQFERDCLTLGLTPTKTLQAWHNSYRDGTSYSRKPAEVEARQHESLNDDLPLAR